jgi:hypothetical protein
MSVIRENITILGVKLEWFKNVVNGKFVIRLVDISTSKLLAKCEGDTTTGMATLTPHRPDEPINLHPINLIIDVVDSRSDQSAPENPELMDNFNNWEFFYTCAKELCVAFLEAI